MNPATRHLEAFEKRLKVEPMELGVQESDIERIEVDKDNRTLTQERREGFHEKFLPLRKPLTPFQMNQKRRIERVMNPATRHLEALEKRLKVVRTAYQKNLICVKFCKIYPRIPSLLKLKIGMSLLYSILLVLNKIAQVASR